MFYSRKARAARIPEPLQELRAAQGGDCRGRQPATSEGWSPGPDGDEWRHSHLLTQIVTLFVLCACAIMCYLTCTAYTWPMLSTLPSTTLSQSTLASLQKVER